MTSDQFLHVPFQTCKCNLFLVWSGRGESNADLRFPGPRLDLPATPRSGGGQRNRTVIPAKDGPVFEAGCSPKPHCPPACWWSRTLQRLPCRLGARRPQAEQDRGPWLSRPGAIGYSPPIHQHRDGNQNRALGAEFPNLLPPNYFSSLLLPEFSATASATVERAPAAPAQVLGLPAARTDEPARVVSLAERHHQPSRVVQIALHPPLEQPFVVQSDVHFGAAGRSRTSNLLLTRGLHCRCATAAQNLVDPARIELAASRLQGGRSPV